MRSSSWAELGLQWAASERREAYRRLADALPRWRRIGPAARAALEGLVLEGRQPGEETRRRLLAGRFIHATGDGPAAPLYAGAAMVGLDFARRKLAPAEARALLTWYRRAQPRIADTYAPFAADRPHGLTATFGTLDREGLVDRATTGRLYSSTVLGWAVAWLLDDAAVLELAGREPKGAIA